MTLPQEPGDTQPECEARQPTRELLLAQALEACIRAERREPGSARAIVELQPAWTRADLHKLIGLTGSLDAAATNAVMSETFRAAARVRLMARIGAAAASRPVVLPAGRLTSVPAHKGTGHKRRGGGSPPLSKWAWRGSASVFAALLGVTATLTASASALPGEPLYAVKQAQEELGLRLASDDRARALALLRSADARLDETSRLLRQGRTGEAVQTTLRYDQTVARATTTFVVTIEETPADPPAAVYIDTQLGQQQEQLEALLRTAPEPARADLRDALLATERSRALVADPRPVERALGRPSTTRPPIAANVPTPALEELATMVPTPAPVLAIATETVPSPVVVRGSDDRAISPLGAQTQGVLRPLVTEPDPRATVRLATGAASGTTRTPGAAGVPSDRQAGRTTQANGRDASASGREADESDGAAQQAEGAMAEPVQRPHHEAPVTQPVGDAVVGTTAAAGGRAAGADGTGASAARVGQANRNAVPRGQERQADPEVTQGSAAAAPRAGEDAAPRTQPAAEANRGGDDAAPRTQPAAEANRGGDDAAPRTQPVAEANRGGEDAAPPAVPPAVRQVVPPLPVVVAQADSRGNAGGASNTHSAGEQVARPAAPTPVVVNGQTNPSTDRAATRDAGAARAESPPPQQDSRSQPSRDQQQTAGQATATPVPARRGTADTTESNKSSSQPSKAPATPALATNPKSGDTKQAGSD